VGYRAATVRESVLFVRTQTRPRVIEHTSNTHPHLLIHPNPNQNGLEFSVRSNI
jgi:hypothetical protein